MMPKLIQSTIRPLFKKYWVIFLVVIFSVPVFASILKSGYYPMHDDFQVIRTFEMDKCIRDGQFPCRWVPDMGFGYGYPQFNYYAPFSYYLMEAIHLTGVSFIDSVKVFIVLITIVSAIGMFLLAKYIWKDNTGAALSAILYLYLPFRAVDIYVRGALPELAAMAIIPFVFLFSGRVVERKSGSVFGLSLSLAVLFLSHNIATLIAVPAVGFWIIFLVAKEKSLGSLKDAALGFTVGIGLAAFFLFPAWFEKGYVHIDTLTSGYFNYLAHFVSLKQMLFSNHWGFGASELGANDDISLSTGIIQWITAVAGVLAILAYRKIKYLPTILFFLAVGAVSLFLMHERSSFIWEKISVLAFIQFPWRFLMLSGFCFSLAAGAIGLADKKFIKLAIAGIAVVLTGILYLGFFQPKAWLNISDKDKLTGSQWTKAITASLYDYLPVSAKKGPDFEAAKVPVVKKGRADISGEAGTDWQKWRVNTTSESSEIELQLYYFPDWTVKVDGEVVKVDYNNTYGLMTVNLTKGSHDIEARLADTKLRFVSNIISLLSIVPLAYVFIKRK